ncbi:hypothetical protein L1999_09345 [Neobacillus drentensis]|uniref:hypothetical protein n=1 Tax=Neobacillus drentensis TaxID=220684 RepID=UPI001F4071C3|nr:hypothetical protein [Neobacillus drentensis]ULT58709.1 hypothetical protein L1999_09345 [Neobacillus drentensis]
MRKFTYEEVKISFEDRGYELLENEYISTRVKMRFRCPKHPNDEQITNFDQFMRLGIGCTCCSGNKKSIDDLKVDFEKRGFKLLETKYVNAREQMRYICKKHPNNINYMSYDSFAKGNGCPLCYNEIKSEKLKNSENNPNWNGGITPLSNVLRNSIKEWKKISLAKYGFRCALSNEWSDDIQIHHPKSFETIRDEVMKELGFYERKKLDNYNQDEIQLILEKLELRNEEILGIPLKKEIHILFHKLYGRKNNTPQQFDEFKNRWEKGEFVGLFPNKDGILMNLPKSKYVELFSLLTGHTKSFVIRNTREFGENSGFRFIFGKQTYQAWIKNGRIHCEIFLENAYQNTWYFDFTSYEIDWDSIEREQANKLKR